MPIEDLNDRVERIVLQQGNVFIRELLRSKQLPVGANKKEFESVLKTAIRNGELKAKDLDAWIERVEGWGNQHIYPFAVPSAISATNALTSSVEARKLVASNRLSQLWGVSHSRFFPPVPQLTRVSFDETMRALMLEWHVRAPGWVRDPSQDIKRKTIGGDLYRFDAFRRQPGRIVTRFVLRIPGNDDRALAALLVRQGVRTSDHATAIKQAWRDLGRITVGAGDLASIRDQRWNLSSLIKKVDSAVVHKKKVMARYQVRGTKLTHQRAAVHFTNTARGPLPNAVKQVRLAIKPKALKKDFEASAGEFGLEADPDRSTSRWTRINLFPAEGRIRIGSELDREDVWNILLTLDGVR